MAIWYEVEKTAQGISDFMECNWCFHDFQIDRASVLPRLDMIELFLRYDCPGEHILLRFWNPISFHLAQPSDEWEYNYILGGSLRLLEDGSLLWADREDETWEEGNWVRARRIIWAVTDDAGIPKEMPREKMDQEWTVYGKKETHHFRLLPFHEDNEP